MASKHVLVVDDEPLILNLIEAALTAHGYRVTVATTGAEALRVCVSTDIDCVLTDVVMPGMSGPSLVLHIRALGKNIPTLLMSGFAESWVEDGAGQVLKKPFTRKELVAGIESALECRTLVAGSS